MQLLGKSYFGCNYLRIPNNSHSFSAMISSREGQTIFLFFDWWEAMGRIMCKWLSDWKCVGTKWKNWKFQFTFSFLFGAKTLSVWKSIAHDPALYIYNFPDMTVLVKNEDIFGSCYFFMSVPLYNYKFVFINNFRC